MSLHRSLLLTSLFTSVLSVAAWPAWACYTVYDSANRVLYQSDKPPVDMSRPLHETLPQRFPGGQMVFDSSAECPVVSPVAIGDGGPSTRTSSPMLTDQNTARKMGAPHRVVDGVAVIPPGSAAVLGGAAAASAPSRR